LLELETAAEPVEESVAKLETLALRMVKPDSHTR
jgi:hypothetical protein